MEKREEIGGQIIHQPSPSTLLAAGAISGSLSVLVCHPIDVIRTRMQLKGGILSHGSGRQPWFSLYRGFAGPFFAQALYKSVIFTTNNVFGSVIMAGEPSYLKSFIAAFLSGSLNSFIVSPIELIRTRQIVSHHGSFLKCVQEVYQSNRSITSFWRVLPPTIARDGPGVAFYLLTFEFLKNKFSSSNISSSSPSSSSSSSFDLQLSAFFSRLLAGSLAGVAFWLWALPIDTLKTNIEASINSLDTVQQSNRSTKYNSSRAFAKYFNGVQSALRDGKIFPADASFIKKAVFLYRAWPAALLRGIPAAAITLTTFDYSIELLNRI